MMEPMDEQVKEIARYLALVAIDKSTITTVKGCIVAAMAELRTTPNRDSMDYQIGVVECALAFCEAFEKMAVDRCVMCQERVSLGRSYCDLCTRQLPQSGI